MLIDSVDEVPGEMLPPASVLVQAGTGMGEVLVVGDV